MKVSLQVAETLEALHPGVRKDLRRALDDLDAGKKRDVRALRHPLWLDTIDSALENTA
ncbi:MAG: hypothetical protein NTX09_04475 [Verrucomicrobia bacterium]|nr:hypothetical protein [Verrucomicrobiota bacterium]